MPKIIISYRRTDADVTGRIFDRLVLRYGKESVFRDIDNIPFGIDFRKVINNALRDTDVFIAIVGPNWRGVSEDGSIRMNDANDLVRVEVETALQRDIPVIPVLVGNALMPKPGELPESLQDFSFRNAANIDSGRNFETDVDRLMRSMERLLENKTGAIDQPPGAAIASLGKLRAESAKVWHPSRRALVIGATLVIAAIGGFLAAEYWRSTSTPSVVSPQFPAVATEQPPPVATATSPPSAVTVTAPSVPRDDRPAPTSDQSCLNERSLKSIEGRIATSITVKNNSSIPVQLYWIDYTGKRTFYYRLDPGRTMVQPTFVTHPWVITDAANKCLAVYMPGTEPREYVVGSKN
jgi:hypothetical protein